MSDRRSKTLQGLLIAWYGDDFTGSAAVMEVLTFAGLPSVLFLDLPTPDQLARFPGACGVGIAGTARSRDPAWMEQHLPPAFDWLARQGAPITHYKICSTLDSAPHVGSIGRAIDLAAPRIGGDWVPVLVAAPPIRRFQAFGTLFAAAPSGVFRLDRHPVMAQHPVTPMDEADVALHLSRQTQRRIGLVDVEALEGDADAALAVQQERGAQVICLDSVSGAHLARVGKLIWNHRGRGLLAVGSQGVEYALVAHWRDAGHLQPADPVPSAGPVDRMVVVSGSVSPVTAAQIDWAVANGFVPIPVDPARIVRGDDQEEVAAEEATRAALSGGRDPLVLTARGPDERALAALRQAAADRGLSSEDANALIGAALGRLLARLLRHARLKRAVISGGDTSGHAAQQLGLFAFTALAPTIPGAALLRAHSETDDFDGLEIALKGGQMGSPDYFGWIKRGGGAA